MQRFYRYHVRRSKAYLSPEEESFPPFFEILEKCWKQYLNIYLVYLVSYTIFPSILINIRPHSNSLYFLSNKYFVPITCHLLFNSSSTLGSLISNLVNSEKPLSDKIWTLISIRLVFVPFFIFCNFLPEKRKWPVIVTNDFIYLFANFGIGFTNGLFGSLSIMYAPKCVTRKHFTNAGMISNLFLMSGIMSGGFLSFLILIVFEY